MPIIDGYDDVIFGINFFELFTTVGLIAIIFAVKLVRDILREVTHKHFSDARVKKIGLVIDLIVPAVCYALVGETLAGLVFVILLAIAVFVTEMLSKRIVAKQAKIQQAENELTPKLANSSCLKSVLNAIMTDEDEWIRKEQGSSDSCRRRIEVFSGGVIIKWSEDQYEKGEKITKNKIARFIFHDNGYSDLSPYVYGAGKKECLSISNVCFVFARLISEHMSKQIPGIKFNTASISFSPEYPSAPHIDNYAYIYYTLPKRKLESII